MQKLELEVKPRDLGQKDVKLNPNELRRQGWIPTVLYGHGEPKSGVVAEKLFLAAMHNKAGRNALFTIKHGTESTLGIIKEIQRHIITHKPIHVDFQRINEKEKIEVNVSVHVIGEAPGVKNSGGILELIQREIRVNCLPNDIPTSIDVDVSKLELGHGIKVQELTPIKGVEFVTAADHIVVNVVAPKVEEETPAPGAVAGAATAEPEVITKGKKDEEGAAAAPAAGGAAAGAKAAPAAAPAAKKEEKKK